jgi:type III restriction enzyme
VPPKEVKVIKLVKEKSNNYSKVAEPESTYSVKGIISPNFWIRNQRNIHFTYGSKKYYPDFIAYKDNIIYIIECKGELFSDTKKNALLEKLNEISGNGSIDGYKGFIVFSTLLDKMGDELWSFDNFIEESEGIFQKHQAKSDLLQDPPSTERFLKYLPVYSPDKAYAKFIKGQKTPKPDGWIEVNPGPCISKFSEITFVIQVKGNALFPQYESGDWIILEFPISFVNLPGKIVLAYNKSINDDYDGNFTVRKLSIEEVNVPTQLFSVKHIHLESMNDKYNDIVISGVIPEIEIVGVELNIQTLKP